MAQSNNQIESKQSSDKKVSTYSNNDNNATQVNVDQAKTSQEVNTKNASASKQLKHLQVTVHNQVILDLDQLVARWSSYFSKTVQRYAAKATTSSLPKYKPQVSSSINNYIRSNNLQAPKIEENYSSYFLNMDIVMVLANLKVL